MTITEPKNLILLTGAGFTHNFGGFLAREMWSKIFNNPIIQANTEARTMLLEDFDFESIYSAKLQHGADVIEVIKKAVEEAYKDLDDTVKNWQFTPDNLTALNMYGWGDLISYLSARGSEKGWFFTLNQDLFMERYSGNRSPGADFGQPYVDRDDGAGVKTVRLPDQDGMEKAKSSLHKTSYIKLHGSYGWISSRGDSQMVIGKNKAQDIEQEPLLKWYFELFKNTIKEGNKKILIIGYGFADNHINEILCEGIRDHGLSLYVINPTDPATFKQQLTDKADGLDGVTLWEGIRGYYPYTLRQVYPPDQSKTSVLKEITRSLAD